MPRKNKQHDKQFKLDAIQYVKEHPDLTQAECARNLGVSITTLKRELRDAQDALDVLKKAIGILGND